jgi:hypothetical protein
MERRDKMKQPRPVGVNQSHHEHKDAVAKNLNLNHKSPNEKHISVPVKK